MVDHILIIEFNNGSKKAYTSIYERYYQPMYYFAKKFVNADDAADITADVFSKLFETKQVFETIDNIKGWLLISIRNACLNMLTREKYKHIAYNEIAWRLSKETPNWLDEKERIERRNAYLKLIDAAVADLSEQKQTLFKLAFIEGLKNPEIAAKMGVSEKQVRDAKSRMLIYLRDYLKEKGVAVVYFAYIFLR